MNSDFCDGFSKEASLAGGLRTGGIKALHGVKKIVSGLGRAGAAVGKATGAGAGHLIGVPATAVGHSLLGAGKAGRAAANRVAGSVLGGSMGGRGVRNAVSRAEHAAPAAAAHVAPAAAPAAAVARPVDRRLGAAIKGLKTQATAARGEAAAAGKAKNRWRAGALAIGAGAGAYGLAAGASKPRNEESMASQN